MLGGVGDWLTAAIQAHSVEFAERTHRFAAFISRWLFLATCVDRFDQWLVQLHALVLESCPRVLLDELLVSVRVHNERVRVRIYQVMNWTWWLIYKGLTLFDFFLGLTVVCSIFHFLAYIFQHSVNCFFIRWIMVVTKFLEREAHFVSYFVIIIKNEACVILRLEPILFANNFESLFVVFIPLPLGVMRTCNRLTGAALPLVGTVYGGIRSLPRVISAHTQSFHWSALVFGFEFHLFKNNTM